MERDETLFPGNANRNKPEKKDVKMVTSKPATRKKKGKLKAFAETVFEDDDGEKISDLIVNDILIPSAKDTASTIVGSMLDMVRDIVERALFGRSYGVSHRDRNHRNASRYSSSYKSSRPRDREPINKHGVDDVVFDSREEAEDVLDLLVNLIEDYGEASISDFYDAAGVTSGNFTDNKYGWNNLNNAKITRRGSDFFIRLPRPIYLDD